MAQHDASETDDTDVTALESLLDFGETDIEGEDAGEDDKKKKPGDEQDDEGGNEGTDEDGDAKGDDAEDDDPDAGDDEGDGDAEDGDADDDTKDEEAWELLDGSGDKVTREEAIKGYMRTADYTQKQQKRAEVERASEAATVVANAKRDEYATLLEKVGPALEQLMPAEPDWEKIKKDNPEGFAQAHADWLIKKDRLDKVQRETDRVNAERQDAAAGALDKHVKAEQVKLVEAMPVLLDPKKGPVVKERIISYAQSIGVSAEDLKSVGDHRLFILLDKARRFDRLQKGKDDVKRKAAKRKAGIKPGKDSQRDKGTTRGKRKRQERMQRLAETGSSSDAMSALEGLPDDT